MGHNRRRQRMIRGLKAGLVDALEPRLLMAVDPETRWMIQFAGGTTSATPTLTVSTNLPPTSGYLKTTDPTTATFSGSSNEQLTASVKVNGVAATLNRSTGA